MFLDPGLGDIWSGGGDGGAYVRVLGGVVYSILGWVCIHVQVCTHGNTVGRWMDGGKIGLAMAMSPSLPTSAPGPGACGSSCSLCGRSWNRWLRRGEPDVFIVLS